MSGRWADSNRKAELPPDWDTVIRPAILARDGYRCVASLRDSSRCIESATDVDHIIPGNDHSPANLQSLCGWHHKRKSAREGQAARTPTPPLRRPPERHPGLK